jgi:hypothetical protein
VKRLVAGASSSEGQRHRTAGNRAGGCGSTGAEDARGEGIGEKFPLMCGVDREREEVDAWDHTAQVKGKWSHGSG